MSRSAILATGHPQAGLLVSDQPAALNLSWNELPAQDGHDVLIEWSCRVACVDSPADRQLLAEHFGVGATGRVTAGDVESFVRGAALPMLRRTVEARAVETLLDGSNDVALSQSIEAEVRKAAFSAGLAILPPFRLAVSSPSRDRERRLGQLRSKLASLGTQDEDRLHKIESLTRSLASVAGSRRVAAVLNDVRLADPRDLLRAAALADSNWSAPRPELWVVAGNKLAWIDPTRPAVSSASLIELAGLGPARSVRSALAGENTVVLVGAQDGVYLVDPAARSLKSSLNHETNSPYGFNSIAMLADGAVTLATHSAVGLVRWEEGVSRVIQAGACRSVLAIDATTAAFVCDGRLAIIGPHGVVVHTLPASELSRVGERFLLWNDAGDVRLLTRDELTGGHQGVRHHVGDGVAAAAVDLVGMERALVATESGRLQLLDFVGAPPIEIGPPGIAARSVRTRPGFIAAVAVDRLRLSLIDLARPESAEQLNVGAVLGNRIADAWFA